MRSVKPTVHALGERPVKAVWQTTQWYSTNRSEPFVQPMLKSLPMLSGRAEARSVLNQSPHALSYRVSLCVQIAKTATKTEMAENSQIKYDLTKRYVSAYAMSPELMEKTFWVQNLLRDVPCGNEACAF